MEKSAQRDQHPDVTLSKSEGSIAVGETLALTATTIPEDAEVTWTSSDATVATVSNGTVTGVATGSATITASITVDEVDYTDTCAVTVTAADNPDATTDTTDAPTI